MFLQNVNSNTAVKIAENAEDISGAAYNSLADILAGFVAHLPSIVAGLLVISIFWLVGKITKYVFRYASARTGLDKRLCVLFSRILDIGIFIIGILTALPLMIPDFSVGGMLAGLGFASFIIGFAARDIFNDLLSGILILWSAPFIVGDYIFLQENEGEVSEIGMRVTSLKMDDGETIQIPNREIYSNALIVRNAGAKRRMQLRLAIDYDADIKGTKQLLGEILFAVKGVEFEPEPSVYVTDLSSEGVNISLYFWIDTNKNSPIKTFDSLASEIKTSLSNAGIRLYPPSTILEKSGRSGTDVKT